VRPLAIDLVDVDSGSGGVKVFLFDVFDRTRVFSAPTGWTEDIDVQGPPGFRTLDLTTLAPQPGFASTATVQTDPLFLETEVVSMEVVMLGSGAVDGLRFSREADPGASRTASASRAASAGSRSTER
jgi:hypothetical protein